MTGSGSDRPASFDPQAPQYESRAALSEATAQAIVAHLVAGLAPGGLVVDVGCGTGLLGRPLLAAGVAYLGFDRSRAMLDEFIARLPAARERVVEHDADGRWPVADGAAQVIVFSRSLHLLDADHLVHEARRIAAPGARIWGGRIERPREAPRQQIRRQLHALLRARGIEPRQGDRARRRFLDALIERGARPLPAWTSAPWHRVLPLGESIERWRAKPGLAGRDLDEATKHAVLDELTEWATATFGTLAASVEVEERYAMEGVQT